MDDKAAIFQKIMEPLTEIEEDPTWDSPFVIPLKGAKGTLTTLPALKSGLQNPPSYMVQMLFCSVADFRWSKGDKSAWEIRVVFRGNRYRIWDHKGGSWSIGSIGDSKPSGQQTTELIKKIRGAAKRLGKRLEPELKTKMETGNYYLINSHRHIRRAYEHFRKMVENTQQEIIDIRSTPLKWAASAVGEEAINITEGPRFTVDQQLTDRINNMMHLDEAVSHQTVGMLGFFFSYVEHLLDAMFAFQPGRAISYLEFRGKTWDERFKIVLPLSKDAKLRQLHNEIRSLRKRIRDQMFHGLGGRPGILVPFGDFGLIPISYEGLSESVQYSWQAVSSQESTEILDVCTAFDDWIDQHDEAWYVRRFIELGFEIPFESDRVGEVRSWMTSRDDFDAALDRLAEKLDYMQDQY